MAKVKEDAVPTYLATERVVLASGIVEKGEKFSSDAVPGRAWKPIDAAAKAAVRARDEAAKASSAPAAPSAREAELEARVAELEAENAALVEQLEAPTAPPPGDEPK